jgi:hypothetical protein
MMRYYDEVLCTWATRADGFGLAQITWATQIGLEAWPARPGSQRPKQGRSSHGAPAVVAVDSGCWRHGEAGKPDGDHRGGVGARFEGSGEERGSPE